jgi:gas vesicle protein
MAISNELSSDIAVAMLAAKNSSEKTRKELKETILRIHSLLQKMEEQARKTVMSRYVSNPSEETFKARV